MHDYLREIDLNPFINGAPAPVISPLDPRGHNDFCFLSDGQEIVLVPVQPFPTAPIRVLVSFDCGHQALLSQPPMVPPGTGPEVHGLLVFDPATGGFPTRNVLRRECCHQRSGVKVWLETPPTAGQPMPVIVVVSAWAKAGACC